MEKSILITCEVCDFQWTSRSVSRSVVYRCRTIASPPGVVSRDLGTLTLGTTGCLPLVSSSTKEGTRSVGMYLQSEWWGAGSPEPAHALTPSPLPSSWLVAPWLRPGFC